MGDYDSRISLDIRKMTEQGNTNSYGPQSEVEYKKWDFWRKVQRRWRQLIGEARFDIMESLWEFMEPSHWEDIPLDWFDDTKVISRHVFTLRLPGYLPVNIHYKLYGYSEWHFSKFEIEANDNGGVKTESSQYHDLPFFLAMAHLNKSDTRYATSYSTPTAKPKRWKVKIEEVEGCALAEGVKLKGLVPDPDEIPDWKAFYCAGGWFGGCD